MSAADELARLIVKAGDPKLFGILGIRQGQAILVEAGNPMMVTVEHNIGNEYASVRIPVLFPYVPNEGDSVWYVQLTGGRTLAVGCTYRA